MSTADRNRAIKTMLTKAFAPHKVSVTGDRGTAYGWVNVKIAYAPRNQRETTELRAKVMALLAATKIEIGTYGYNDPGSDYGHGKEINISFDRVREQADYHGEGAWRHHLSAEDWDRVQAEDRARTEHPQTEVTT